MKTKIALLFTVLSFLAVICVSCKNDEVIEDYLPLSWTSASFNVSWDVSSTSIPLKTNTKTEWEIFFENPVDWCSVSALKGTGRQDILFTFDRNTAAEKRQVVVHARNINDKAENTTIKITQDANPIKVSISSTSFFQDASAANCSINISATGEWAVSYEVEYISEDWKKYPWCTLKTPSGVSDGVIVIGVAENTTEAKRVAIITLRSGKIMATDTIIQSGVPSDEVGVEINGVTWATRNVGAYGQFASNAGGSYGKHYQYNNRVAFPNENIPIGENPNDPWIDRSGGYLGRMLWSPLDDPSPDGWRIPTKEEADALVRSGYRWVKQADSYIGCAGAWAGPDAEIATFDNPGKAVFLPALEIISTNEASNEYAKNRGVYHATGRVSSGNSMALFVSETGFESPLYRGPGGNWACSIRCVKK